MSVAATVMEVRVAAEVEARRQEMAAALSTLLARSDALLAEAEEANCTGLPLRPGWRLDLLGLIAAVEPQLLQPRPSELNGLHVRLGLAVRGWRPGYLAAASGLALTTVEKARVGNIPHASQRRRLCGALSEDPRAAAVRRDGAIDSQQAVDAVFDAQEVLFVRIRLARNTAHLVEEEECAQDA